MNRIIKELKSYKWIYIFLVSIVLLSAVLRLWGLSNVPFVADEFLDVNATYGYHKTGEWQAWDFNQNDVSVRDNRASDERAWLYRWQVAQVLNYLEPTESTFRLISVLWGILTTIILYFVTFSFTRNRWIALAAAFLWAVSVPAIDVNRKIRMYSMFAPMFLIFSWSLFKFIDSNNKCTCDGVKCSGLSILKGILNLNWIYIIPTLVFGAISYHLHPLTGNIAIILFTYFVIMFFIKRKEIVAKRYGAYIILMIAGTILMKILTPSIWNSFVSSLIFFDDHWSYVGHITRNYWHPLLGLLFMFSGACYLIKKQDDERPGVWIVSVFFTILLAAIFLWNRNVGPQYIFFVQVYGLILSAAGIYAAAQYLQSKMDVKNIFAATVIFGAITLPFYGYFGLENNTYRITSEGDQANYRKVFDYVKRNSIEGDAMIARNFRNYYWSGLKLSVLDFGSERSEEQLESEGKVKKVTIADLVKMMDEYSTGWIVFSDNDKKFITKEARDYFDENLEEVDDSSLVRGKVSVYRWNIINK